MMALLVWMAIGFAWLVTHTVEPARATPSTPVIVDSDEDEETSAVAMTVPTTFARF